MMRLGEDGKVNAVYEDITEKCLSSMRLCNMVGIFLIFQWRKHWFVLANQSLRFYRDSVAEEVCLHMMQEKKSFGIFR